jgi:hypothetical protein
MEETLYQRARELGLVRKERQARWEDAGLYLNYLHAERGAGGGNDHNKHRCSYKACRPTIPNMAAKLSVMGMGNKGSEDEESEKGSANHPVQQRHSQQYQHRHTLLY